MNSAMKVLVPLGLILLGVLVVLSGMAVVVEAGHVGVLRTLGAVRPEPLKEGFHLKRPFLDQIEQVDIRLVASHAEATAASRDLQTVTTQVTTQYSMNGELAPLTYQRVGNLGKVSAALVEPAIQECVKAVTAKFTAEELVTKRELVKQQIQQALVSYINTTLREKGSKTPSMWPTLPSPTSTFHRNSTAPSNRRCRPNSRLYRPRMKS